MPKYLILAEKTKVMNEKFIPALGSKEGTFEGETFRITSAQGHLLTYKDPALMLKDKTLSDKYSSWKLKDLPWDPENDFLWSKIPTDMGKSYLPKIKKALADVENVVIATDNDPTGEGQMIGWEIINAIGWKGPVLRMIFADDSAKTLQNSFRNLKKLRPINQFKDGEYLKAESRSRWDYISMQETRAATTVAQSYGYGIKSVRQGRLKSVIIRHIYEQLEAIKNYVKKPYFEVRFKDENGNVFSKKDNSAFEEKTEAETEKTKFSSSPTTNIQKERKTSSPGALLDLSGLAARLSTKGFKAKEVLETYQKMYEAEFVSYPRTEDKKITIEQYNDLLPLIDDIARLVNVDTSLLSHRKPRKKHITKDAAHGANRPGLKIPGSLSELSKFGKSAISIYETLAKNYLSIIAEDYIYEHITANLSDYPDYNANVNVPVELNFKSIFSNDEENNTKVKSIGSIANPFVYEGANKKPEKPTMKWITKFLEKYNVGTGATRTSTLAEITTGDNSPLKEEKGAYSITPVGNITAILNENTWLASVDVTQKLFEGMQAVGKFKITPGQILGSATNTIKHDLPIIIENGEKLTSKVLITNDLKKKEFVQKEKAEGIYEPSGKPVSFNKKWGSHEFTDEEIENLFKGEEITIDGKITGKLAEQTYKGHKFWGFKKVG